MSYDIITVEADTKVHADFTEVEVERHTPTFDLVAYYNIIQKNADTGDYYIIGLTKAQAEKLLVALDLLLGDDE